MSLDPATVEALAAVGATESDLADHGGDLADLVSIWATRPGVPEFSLRDAAERTGLSVPQIRAFRRAGGLPAIADEDTIAISEQELKVFEGFRVGIHAFGEPAALQIVRVIGAAALRVADTATSAFLVNIERELPDTEPATVAQANITATSMLPIVTDAIDVFLRHHIIGTRRSHEGLDDTGQYEVSRQSIGFADVVGSTRLTQALPLGDLASLLSRLEDDANDVVNEHGGRLVKLIGDEVMFSAPTAEGALAIADGLHRVGRAIEHLPVLRVGIASGETMHRQGDLFGPAVNRAARIVVECLPGRTLVDDATRQAIPELDPPRSWKSIGHVPLRGFEEPEELWTPSSR